MNMTRQIVERIFKSKVPKTATHFFHEGGMITFICKKKNKVVFKPRKMTKVEYKSFSESTLKPFKEWSLQ